MIVIRTFLYSLLGSVCVSAQVHANTGIVVAFESSLNSIKREMIFDSVRFIAKREFFAGSLDGQSIVLVRSPMGKVNNAITTQLLLSHYDIDLVISISPAGAISDDIDIGDMVIANSLIQHDFGAIKPYGFVAGNTPDGIDWKEADYILTNGTLSHDALDKIMVPGINSIHIGTVVSGDQFIASPLKRTWLQDKYGADAVDMGGAAIGQVCQANNVRLLVARIITDRAGVTARAKFPAWNDSYSSGINMGDLSRVLLSINAQPEPGRR